MKNALTLLLFFVCVLPFGQKVDLPKGYQLIVEKSGDLDKDGINEKVMVYNTADSTEAGTIREIQILKKTDGKWVVWKKSRNAILKSNEG